MATLLELEFDFRYAVNSRVQDALENPAYRGDDLRSLANLLDQMRERINKDLSGQMGKLNAKGFGK